MPFKKNSITIIGTGLSAEDITPRALEIIENADILIGGHRQLAFFENFFGEKIAVTRHAADIVKGLRRKLRGKQAVVLTSGDPNFFGIAALFYRYFDGRQVTVIPNATAFQWAFARIQEPWDEASFISVHGREMRALDRVLREAGTFVVYCDNRRAPADVAAYLTGLDRGLGACRAWVFDRLGTEEEQIFVGTLKKMAGVEATALSMMIIRKEGPAGGPESVGIPDDAFAHQRGMITKRDIRLMALARLELGKRRVLWDIGAGSGSVSIEAANLYCGLDVYAVEGQERRFRELQKNVRKFKLPNVFPRLGRAPEALAGLPAPDSIFIGGSGGRLPAILNAARNRIQPGGCVVVNFVQPAVMAEACRLLEGWGWKYDITSAQLSHLESGSKPEIFRAENPVWVLRAMR